MPKKKFTKLTKPEVRSVRRMFKSGKSRSEIATELNHTYAQVNYAIKKAAFRSSSKKPKKTIARPIREMKNIDWKAKYMQAAIILLENGLVELVDAE